MEDKVASCTVVKSGGVRMRSNAITRRRVVMMIERSAILRTTGTTVAAEDDDDDDEETGRILTSVRGAVEGWTDLFGGQSQQTG